MVLVAPVAAQEGSGAYLRLSLGAARTERPEPGWLADARGWQPSLAFGYRVDSRHTLELIGTRLSSEKSQDPSLPFEERELFGPYSIGVRATSLEVAYRYGLPLHEDARLRPFAHLGLAWWSVEDWWDDDTDIHTRRSSASGLRPGLGVAVALVDDLWMSARGGYRFSTDADDRYARGIGLAGAHVELGVEWGF
jgi:opacity protein-like surface antigen